MGIKNALKNIGKALLVSLIYFVIAIGIFLVVYDGDSDKVIDVVVNIIVMGFVLLMIGTFFFFDHKDKRIPLKEGKMKSYKDFIIADIVRSGNVVLAIYFYRYKDNKFDDSFFFSCYGRYRFENAEGILGRISSFCGELPLITDKVENYQFLDKIFIFNNVDVLTNERCAINEYVRLGNIKKDFARSEYEFTPIEDAFIGSARKYSSLSTKQIFEGKLMYILSYYDNLKEVL